MTGNSIEPSRVNRILELINSGQLHDHFQLGHQVIMDAIFTLPYSEYAAANMLAEHFKPSKAYSIFVPASRAEKGVDLLLAARSESATKALTFQVKASRTYPGTPAKRVVDNRRFAYYTWFNRFNVPHQADFFMLYGLFPPEQATSKKVAKSWWQSLCLVFTRNEMVEFMACVKTKSGAPDRMFSFGFDDPTKVFLTRGSETHSQEDCSRFLFHKQLQTIRNALEASAT